MSLLTLKGFRDMQDPGNLKKGILVLDGDWLVYQAMIAAEFDASWEEEVWHRCCDHAKAREFLEESIKSYVTRKKAWIDADVVLAFTDRINWRKTLVDPSYKSNRAATKKPVGYFEFLEALFEREEFFCIREDRLEGDDVMGIIGSNPMQFGYKKAVLVSCDKDFKTIPNCDFLWCTKGNLLTQTLETADYWHTFQMIKGDITDGYKGIPGWGEGTVDFLKEPFVFIKQTSIIKTGENKGNEVTKWYKRDLTDEETLWDAIVSLGAKAGMTEEDVIKQGQMARILRSDDYNVDTKEITLWMPSRGMTIS